LKNGAKQIDRK